VGSAKSINVDFRLISATNSPIQEMIKNDKFRQDLYYRMNTFEIKIPPLRERKEDIPELTEYFVNKLKKKYNRPNLKINKQITNQLKKHDWPGNIRELQNTLERAVILSENNKLDLKHLTLSNIRPDVNTDSLNIEENEKKLILKALDKTNGNITRAAKELGLKRNALYRRLEKYGLQ
jgi:transcriptional regulator with PAS, ATPase and Fis domain